MDKSKIIDYIYIKNLHGYKNIKINFDSPFLILLSENGQGKSTILRIINSCLCLELNQLENIKFEKIIIKFTKTQDKAILKKDDLSSEILSNSYAYDYIRKRLPEIEFKELIYLIKSNPNYESIINNVKQTSFLKKYNIPNGAIKELIIDSKKIVENDAINSFTQIIEKNFTKKPLYLPTYRRIEQLMEEISSDVIKDKNIQFGLQDVKNRIEEIRQTILTSSNDTMSRINSEILKKLINGLKVNKEEIKIIEDNKKDIDLLLNRFGKNLTDDEKEKIKKETFKDNSEKSDPALIYFISKMFNSFFEQRKKDQALKDFTEICSKYFNNKTMDYDENSIKVSVNLIQNKIICEDEIPLEDLSSGEKQIISLFSKLFLEEEQEYFILFDEPELSLSVEWQKMLLNDVLKAPSCHMLLCMTHSPFIFDNLEDITYDLNDFFLTDKECNNND
ncbi:AAA family ATPase [Acinetobacter seifertii]|uniref:AAA family ATPase n=3 Tax=Acinetobacter seifertii TaxID=1530123 RepID=A0A7H2PT75_9GAMM|nr:AAA family ATPase [Acinetobacter seifertii]MDO7398727.1 AAA family ATPase [Acinetobacter baumannii]MDO7452006.1 AAA family ATPase [Acinetobacter baumannii]QNX06058.1 AAA family ATPase [Acinetobacter seifertii]